MSTKTLALFFTRGISLKIWKETGLLEREKLLYHAHLECGDLQQVLWMTYGALDEKIAKDLKVRKLALKFQKNIAYNPPKKYNGSILDGRDIGTVVFTNAELKIFMTSTPETRAKRRFDELIQKGEQVSYKDVYTNVVERDSLDTTRKDSPLVKADDAIEIDNSHLTKEKQFEIILKLVEEKLRDV